MRSFLWCTWRMIRAAAAARRSASASMSSAVRSRAAQMVGFPARSAYSRYHPAKRCNSSALVISSASNVLIVALAIDEKAA